MSGIQVLRELRRDSATAKTAVLFLSAGFDPAKREEAMALGAADWLVKGGGWAGALGPTLQSIIDCYCKAGGTAISESESQETGIEQPERERH